MQDDKGGTTTSFFVAYCIMIIISLYLVASTLSSFLPVPHHTFTIIFTVSGGIPALTLFFKKYVNRKTID
jgi:NhaP-type Na+/H+ or K+/H+ antiporter